MANKNEKKPKTCGRLGLFSAKTKRGMRKGNGLSCGFIVQKRGVVRGGALASESHHRDILRGPTKKEGA